MRRSIALAATLLVGLAACVRGQNAESVTKQMRSLMDVGRYDEAIREGKTYIAKDAAPAVLNTLGEVLYLRGERAEAQQAFARSAEVNGPHRLAAQLNLAILDNDAGRIEAARAAFHKIVAYYNEHPKLSADELVVVGRACRYLGQENPDMFKDALRAFDEAAGADPSLLTAKLEAGELLLAKYNSTDAHEAFNAVLKVNPKDARALTGHARALEFDGAAGVVQPVRGALGTNPNYEPAHLLLARQEAAAEKFDAAAAELEAALRINPSSLDALAHLAALRYVQGKTASYDSIRARVMQLNPRYSNLYVAVAEALTAQRRYSDAAQIAQTAVNVDSTSWNAWGVLGTSLMRVGRIGDARTSLEKSFRGDPYNVWNKNTLDLLDTFSRYRTVRNGRVELMLESREADALSPYIAGLAEEAIQKLSKRYGYSPDTTVRIEVYPNHADFSVRTLGLPGLGALGVTFGKLISMDSPSARERGEFNWGSTLWHELAHVITLGLGKQRLPRWFAEGLAVYEERHARDGWGADVTMGFLSAYMAGKLEPFSRLNDGFVRPKFPEQIGLSYYEASLFCDMIERDYGFDTLLAMIRAYGTGANTDQVFRQVLKTDVTSFDPRFDAYMKSRFQTQLQALSGLSRQRQSNEADSTDFISQLAKARVLIEQDRDMDAVPYLTRAKALFPQYAAPDSPYQLLANIYSKRGDKKGAIVELQQLVRYDENSYDALIQLSILQDSVGDKAGAAASLDRAIYVYPFDPQVHGRLANYMDALGDRQRALRERGVIVALAPTDRAEALYQLAAAYMRAGDRTNARTTVLRALEIAPAYDRAQELLLQLSESKSQ